MAKRHAVHGFSIEEVTRELRKTEFVRDSSKKQYKTVNNKRFSVFCGCDAKKVVGGFEGITTNFMQSSCIAINLCCPVCLCSSYIDITSLNLPEE